MWPSPPRRLDGGPLLVVTLLAAAAALGGAATRAAPPRLGGTGAAPRAAVVAAGCLPGGDGFLRARLRGALNLDLAWRDAEMQCAGGARPDGTGLRVTLGGPLQSNGRRLRFVFGIARAPEGATVRAQPVNVTLIFEGEQRLFATRGDDKCTIDELRQDRLDVPGGSPRRWRVTGRGFCIGPATALPGGERLLLTSFDFASIVTFEDPPHDDPPSRP